MANRLVKINVSRPESQFDKPWHRDAFIDATHRIAHLGYCEWDYQNGCIISCSQHYAEIFGMSIEEVIDSQSTWEKVLMQLHPDDRANYAKSHAENLGKGTHEIEYRIFRKDGAIRHIREVGIVFFDEYDNPTESMGLLQDITDQKDRLQNLENRDAMAQQVEKITDIGHFIWDIQNENYRYVSPGYLRIFEEESNSNAPGVESLKDYLAQIHAEDRERVTKDYRNQIEHNQDMVTEYRILRPGGDFRWLREKSIVIRDSMSGADQAIGVIQDITEQKKSEQGLRQAKESLEIEVDARTQKLSETVDRLNQEMIEREAVSSELEVKNAELERFTYTVSHDLKSPLVTIKGFLGLLEKDIESNNRSRIAQDIEKLKSATDTMGNLLNDLLELSRIGRVIGEPVTCNLSEIAARALELTKTDLDLQHIEIIVQDLPSVKGDELRLVEVFINLIENAIKFMGDQESPQIQIGARKKDGMICCSIRDNGAGIEGPYLKQIFELFERLSAGVDGTGVGLALVKRIIETHGGQIWAESAGPGKGCTISFTLPCA